jgi:hypothetical protein
MEGEFILKIVAVFFIACISGGIGSLIGGYRGRENAGMGFGFFLGPIGWIITGLLPEDGKRCPECLGVVPPKARRCRHCGELLQPAKRAEVIEQPSSTTEPQPTWFVAHVDGDEGPFTLEQLKAQWHAGKLNSDDVCAEKGDSDWKPVTEVIKPPVSKPASVRAIGRDA